MFRMIDDCWTKRTFVPLLKKKHYQTLAYLAYPDHIDTKIIIYHRHQILGNLWLRGVFQLWLQAASVRNVVYVPHPGSYRLATTPY